MNTEELVTSEKLLKNLREVLCNKKEALSMLTEDLDKFIEEYQSIILPKESRLKALEIQIKSLTKNTFFIPLNINTSTFQTSKDGELNYKTPPPPSYELKSLYRKLVKKIHPDLCSSVEEKSKKTEILMEVNNAYDKNDYFTLLQIWNSIDDTIDIESKINMLKDEIAAIDKNLYDLKCCPMFKLKSKADMFKLQGIDYINVLSNELDIKIKAASEKLSHLRDINIINKF